jgi:CubicO group peptidase (beta-lactamase class C family)
MAEVHGETARGFEAVRDAFSTNFERHGEVGAAFSLYHQGRRVVDIWGGVADEATGRAWAEDTLQLVFSTTKGATAACAHLLAQRGELDFDAPVSGYWPEFKAEGKEQIPVRWLLSHRAGLPVVDRPLTPEDLLTWDVIVDALAAQRPVWEPGTAHGYHALTYGWLVGEVVRRISGKSLGRFFADEIAAPLDLEFWIGLPPEQEPRVSRLIELPRLGVAAADVDLSGLPEAIREMAAAFLDPESLTNRALSVSSPPPDYNSRELHAAELPAANGICTARSLARFYAGLIGEVDGVRILRPETVANATVEQSVGPDRVLLVPTRFGLGYFLPAPFSPMAGPASFGHAGAGGSLGFADPETGVAFGYVMNKMQQNLAADARTLTLIEAVTASI